MTRRARPVAWMLTLALHVLVGLLLVWHTGSRQAQPPVKRVSVRLLALPEPPHKRTVTLPIMPATSPRHPAARTVTRAVPSPQDTTSTPSPATPAPFEAPREPTTASNTSAAPPLSLALPASAASSPRSMVNAALNDPRSNSRRLTPGERFAATLGTNTERVEERIVDGVRVRQGNSCVLVHESKGAFIDPFNQSMRPLPKMAEKCP